MIASTTYVWRPDMIAPTASVLDQARVTENARVDDYAVISGFTSVAGYAFVGGNARLAEYVSVYDYAYVEDDVKIWGHIAIGGKAAVTGHAEVFGGVTLGGSVRVTDNAHVYGQVSLNSGRIGRDADIFRSNHVIVITGAFPEQITLYRTVDGGARIQAGCQNFPLDIPMSDLQDLAHRHGWKWSDAFAGWINIFKVYAAAWEDHVYTGPKTEFPG